MCNHGDGAAAILFSTGPEGHREFSFPGGKELEFLEGAGQMKGGGKKCPGKGAQN